MIEIRAALNPSSAIGQGPTRRVVEDLLTEVVRCLVQLQPKLNTRTALLLFDPRLENASVGLGESLVESLNRLRDRQTVRQWFLYTRNRARAVSVESQAFRIVSKTGEIAAELSTEMVQESTHWISFNGAPVFRGSELRVSAHLTATTFVRRNASTSAAVQRWLPRYEASPKHGRKPYISSRGPVSVMDLQDHDATFVLQHSLRHTDELRFGFSGTRFYAFRLTCVDREQAVFHGYAIEECDVPRNICNALRASIVQRS